MRCERVKSTTRTTCLFYRSMGRRDETLPLKISARRLGLVASTYYFTTSAARYLDPLIWLLSCSFCGVKMPNISKPLQPPHFKAVPASEGPLPSLAYPQETAEHPNNAGCIPKPQRRRPACDKLVCLCWAQPFIPALLFHPHTRSSRDDPPHLLRSPPTPP